MDCRFLENDSGDLGGAMGDDGEPAWMKCVCEKNNRAEGKQFRKHEHSPLKLLDYSCAFISPSTLKLFEAPAIVILLFFSFSTHTQCSDWLAVATR